MWTRLMLSLPPSLSFADSACLSPPLRLQPSLSQSGPDPVCRCRKLSPAPEQPLRWPEAGPTGSGSSSLRGCSELQTRGEKVSRVPCVSAQGLFRFAVVCRGEDLPEVHGPTPGLPRPRGEDT